MAPRKGTNRNKSLPKATTISGDLLSGSYDTGTQTGTLVVQLDADLDLNGQTKVSKDMKVTLEVIKVDVGGVEKLGLRLTLA